MSDQRPPAAVARDWGQRLDPRPQLTRRSFADRVERLRNRSFLILQCAVFGSIAWLLAHNLLDHPQPFFAPITVLVTLGLTYGQRIRRVLELTVGVAVGVLIGDTFVHVFGTGAWQLAVVVTCSMSVAVLLGAGGLIMIQAGVQSLVVLILVAPPGTAFSRWLDAVIGGLVALVAATITPTSPVRRPRVQAGVVVTELSAVLTETATAVRRRDQERADAALERARSSEELLEELREATTEGIAVTRQSPFRRRHGASVVGIADILEPLDRAVRNLRVLVRRGAVAVWSGEAVPPSYLDLVDDLAAVMERMAGLLLDRKDAEELRPDLLRIARRSGVSSRRSSLSGEVIRAQVRSIVVDLLILTGLTYVQAREQVPARADDLDD
ncbi:FUSC family protein [Luteipulveratus sp. YIM 133132]|uniref:FUSC family protein n=1 Tax=Luteipulveratus flavus TaxID=3031728 RepID=A0ABT6C5K5_9MICO|nr:MULTISPECIES: FUSC family protein [unclassified Luteipulveratus]MDE9366026.1 FUSC family protein [Luteipulveratus sp. YIM 133132]MDF8264128.1 FUSC family protein [Luteipulveratus sp. YIM 133296]